jgi:hypothetical protein
VLYAGELFVVCGADEVCFIERHQNTLSSKHRVKYDLNWLINRSEEGERLKFLFFWGYQPDKSGELTSTCFSQWWHCPFEVDGITYLTTEHWMMAEKARLFGDKEILPQILSPNTPGEAKSLGREVKNFDQKRWEEYRYAIVVKGNLYKFRQHPELREYLLGTNDRILVEASPIDTIWGIGLTADSDKAKHPTLWNGTNLLGFALMEVRDVLREEKMPIKVNSKDK